MTGMKMFADNFQKCSMDHSMFLGRCTEWEYICDMLNFQIYFGVSADATIVPAKSDSDVVFCLQLLSKTLTCTLHLS